MLPTLGRLVRNTTTGVLCSAVDVGGPKLSVTRPGRSVLFGLRTLSQGLGGTCVWILALSFDSCVMWGLLINLAQCQFQASLAAQLAKNPLAVPESLA